MPTVVERRIAAGTDLPGRIKSASTSGVLWSCPPVIGRISSTTARSRGGDRVDRRRVAWRDKWSAGSYSPIAAPASPVAAGSCPLIALEQLTTIGRPVASSTEAALPEGHEARSAQAQPLLARTRPDPSTSGSGDRRERQPAGGPCGGSRGAEAPPGRPASSPAPPREQAAQPEKAIHELPALDARSSAWAFSARSARTAGPECPTKLRARAVSGCACRRVGLIACGRAVRGDLPRRRGLWRDRDANAFARRSDVVMGGSVRALPTGGSVAASAPGIVGSGAD